MFSLIDVNSFYCSAEQVFRPDWRGKPVIVLSNNDGCVVAANRQAKEAGVPKFVPYFQIKDLCQKKVLSHFHPIMNSMAISLPSGFY